jgi:hypothetical protein
VVGAWTPDRVLDALTGGETGAFATTRFLGEVGGRGALAIDGDRRTAWSADPERVQALTLRFPERTVDRVAVSMVADRRHSAIRELRVTVGDAPPRRVRVPAGGRPEVAVSIPRTVASGATVEVLASDVRRGTFGVLPFAITEVDVAGARAAVDLAAALPDGCRPDLVAIDDDAVPVRLTGTVDDVLRGRPIPVALCSPLALETGWHRLDSQPAAAGALSLLRLRAPGAVPPSPPPSDATVLSSSPTRLQVRVDGDRATRMLSGRPFAPGWRARVGGRDLGPPRPYDTLNGWMVPVDGAALVTVTYRPQRAYEIGLAVTAATLVLLVALAARRE